MKTAVQVQDRSVVDAVIGGLLLAVFVVAFLIADSWARDARLVPQVICVLGGASSLVRLAQLAGAFRRHRRQPEAPPVRSIVSEDADAVDLEPEVVFARASAADWLRVVVWCAFFFVLLFAAGVYVATAVFSLTYLVLEGGTRIWQAAAYAATAVLLLYLVFDQLLTTPLPEGLLRF